MNRVREYFCRKCNKSVYVRTEQGERPVCPECSDGELVIVPGNLKKPLYVPCNCPKKKEE